jgi:hypothetical protein
VSLSSSQTHSIADALAQGTCAGRQHRCIHKSATQGHQTSRPGTARSAACGQ